MPSSKFQAILKNRKMAADDVAILTFETLEPISYTAGQAFYINAHDEDPRPYSIANTPIDGKNTHLEFHIGRGRGVSRILIDDIPLNSPVHMEGPQGHMKFKSVCKKPIITIAGGTGLAQMKAICETALLTNRENPVYLFHGARNEEGLYLHEHFLDLMRSDSRFNYVTATSEEKSPDVSIKHGFIGDVVSSHVDNLAGFRAYICGPNAMVVHSRERLIEKGIDETRLHIENWTTTKRV